MKRLFLSTEKKSSRDLGSESKKHLLVCNCTWEKALSPLTPSPSVFVSHKEFYSFLGQETHRALACGTSAFLCWSLNKRAYHQVWNAHRGASNNCRLREECLLFLHRWWTQRHVLSLPVQCLLLEAASWLGGDNAAPPILTPFHEVVWKTSCCCEKKKTTE